MKRFVVIAFLLSLAAAPPSRSASVYTQAESFVAYNEIQYTAISVYSTLLRGLDYPGEWVEYRVSAPAYGTYTVQLRCWGELNVDYHLHLVTLPVAGEEPQTIDIDFTGLGDDCA